MTTRLEATNLALALETKLREKGDEEEATEREKGDEKLREQLEKGLGNEAAEREKGDKELAADMSKVAIVAGGAAAATKKLALETRVDRYNGYVNKEKDGMRMVENADRMRTEGQAKIDESSAAMGDKKYQRWYKDLANIVHAAAPR